MQNEFFTYLDSVLTTDGGGSTPCKNISEKFQHDIMQLTEWAFDNERILPRKSTSWKFSRLAHRKLRAELRLDDILNINPKWTKGAVSLETLQNIQEQLKNISGTIFAELKARQMLDETRTDDYIMVFNILKILPTCPAQSWHQDFGDNPNHTHHYNTMIPLTDTPLQGGTRFGSPPTDMDDWDTAGVINEMPSEKKPYTWNGWIWHKGEANQSDKIRYTLNVDTVCWTGIPGLCADAHQNRWGFRCHNQEIIQTGTLYVYAKDYISPRPSARTMKRTEEKYEINQHPVNIGDEKKRSSLSADTRRNRSESRKRRAEQQERDTLEPEVTADAHIADEAPDQPAHESDADLDEEAAPVSNFTQTGEYNVTQSLTACLGNLHSRLCALEMLD
jgi:hypothetical protein